MRRFLTGFYEFLRGLVSDSHYDAFSRSPLYFKNEWESPCRVPPMSCEAETLEQMRDRWRFR